MAVIIATVETGRDVTIHNVITYLLRQGTYRSVGTPCRARPFEFPAGRAGTRRAAAVANVAAVRWARGRRDDGVRERSLPLPRRAQCDRGARS